MADYSLYPIAVIEDRYGGTYSGGAWLAVANADENLPGILSGDGPHGGDGEAMVFWSAPPWWIAAGSDPNAAVAALKAARIEARAARTAPGC